MAHHTGRLHQIGAWHHARLSPYLPTLPLPSFAGTLTLNSGFFSLNTSHLCKSGAQYSRIVPLGAVPGILVFLFTHRVSRERQNWSAIEAALVTAFTGTSVSLFQLACAEPGRPWDSQLDTLWTHAFLQHGSSV